MSIWVHVRRTIVAVAVVLQAAAWASGAMASAPATFWPPQSDPGSNFAVPPNGLPFSCLVSPESASCINAAVFYLDKARARLGQPAYKLPASFPQLSAAKQAFILTNLDRKVYNLPPIAGLTAQLDEDAQKTGVLLDADPLSTDPSDFPDYTANWAGPFDNMPLAYEAWLYDDGYGSQNLECTSATAPGCWGHRHDVLYETPATGPTAMGAATGKDTSGNTGYAMLLGAGTSSYSPTYIYTWRQAQAAGAGSHTYAVSRPPIAKLRFAIGVIGHVLSFTIEPPIGKHSVGSHLRCSLVRESRSGFPADRLHTCIKVAVFRNAKPGTYQFDVTSSIGWARGDFTLP